MDSRGGNCGSLASQILGLRRAHRLTYCWAAFASGSHHWLTNSLLCAANYGGDHHRDRPARGPRTSPLAREPYLIAEFDTEPLKGRQRDAYSPPPPALSAVARSIGM